MQVTSSSVPSLIHRPTTVSTIQPSAVIKDDQVLEVSVNEDKTD